jgi:hypothetical protein
MTPLPRKGTNLGSRYRLYTRKGDNKQHGDVQIEKYAACEAAE